MAHMRTCHLLHSRKSGKVNLGLSNNFLCQYATTWRSKYVEKLFLSNHIIKSKLSKVIYTYGKLEMHNIWHCEAPPPPKNANFSCRSHASQIKSLKKYLHFIKE